MNNNNGRDNTVTMLKGQWHYLDNNICKNAVVTMVALVIIDEY